MTSLYKKVISGKPYWDLREMGWVDGKPKMVSERDLGGDADIEALLDAREAAVMPGRTRHLAFGDVAAAWGMLEDLGVAAIIDEVAGPGPPGQPLSTGTYLALAALNRLIAPCSKAGFADWWKTTAAGRFARIPATALDHRRFWDAMHAVTLEQMDEISRRIAIRIVRDCGVDVSSVALDMTNFATFIDTANGKAPIAQRGKAKQKRADLRLVGLGLVVTRDGGIPLTWHAYPGDRPDVTQFTTVIGQLRGQYEAITAAAGVPAADMTVVFDAGQNSEEGHEPEVEPEGIDQGLSALEYLLFLFNAQTGGEYLSYRLRLFLVSGNIDPRKVADLAKKLLEVPEVHEQGVSRDQRQINDAGDLETVVMVIDKRVKQFPLFEAVRVGEPLRYEHPVQVFEKPFNVRFFV